MKLMPFLTADSGAVHVQEPKLHCGDKEFAPRDPVETWDYLTPISIAAAVTVNEEVFRKQTGIMGPNGLLGLVLTLQVDCPATAFRKIGETPVVSALNRVATIRVEIPPGQVAKRLDVAVFVVLDRPDVSPKVHRVAHLRGSKLFTSPHLWRFYLEGTGGGFPTEAINFASVGLPRDAPWKLKVERDGVHLPLMGAVRLLVNSAHPLSGELLRGDAGLATSMLEYDLLVQMLLAVGRTDPEDLQDFDDDSLGAVLDGHTQTYTALPLIDALREIEEDPTWYFACLKDGMGMGVS